MNVRTLTAREAVMARTRAREDFASRAAAYGAKVSNEDLARWYGNRARRGRRKTSPGKVPE